MVMKPQTQKSPAKVDKANGKGKPTLGTSNREDSARRLGSHSSPESRAGKPFWNTARTARSSCRETLRIPSGISNKGKVKLAVTSQQGKEAIVSVLGDNEFFGEGCLAGQPLRISTATAVSDCTLYRIEKALMVRLLHEQHGISELFITHLLSRNTRFEEDLVDQLFNSSEKRLARILLLLAHFGKESRTETVHPGINQEHLAQMVGTTRSRVSHFMNKFRTLGFIDYTGNGALTVNSGLLSVVLSD